MHPLPDKVQQIRERSFAVIPGVLPAAEVPILRQLLQQCIDDDLARWQGKPYVDAWMVHNLMVRHVKFAQVLDNPSMHAYLSEFLKNTCIVYAYTSSSMPPGGSNYSHRIHVDCPRLIPGYICNMGLMLALDDFTAENGAPYFLPSSHERATPPSKDEFFAQAERGFARAGDMVLFNARCWHLGGQNTTQRARHALTINVCRSYMRQRFDYPRMMPPEILGQVGETARRFLGYNVRMPTSLEEYYLPEEQRLYKANQG